MAEIVADIDGFGAFDFPLGLNGSDDTLILNIGTGFSGSINVTSNAEDGEIDRIIVNLPEGWQLALTGEEQLQGSENPPAFMRTYFIMDAQGTVVGPMVVISNNDPGVPCLARGTMIEAANGPVAIETLRPGDLIATADHGMQPLRWIGSVMLDATQLARQPHLRPIRIKAGALGQSRPSRDLLVSPQHRVLLRSAIAQRMFGTSEILVAAKQLLGLDDIETAHDVPGVEYFHLLFDRHEVIFSNGAETESLYTGAEALKALGPDARAEILALFPQLADGATITPPARLLAPGARARQLARRHRKNAMPVLA